MKTMKIHSTAVKVLRRSKNTGAYKKRLWDIFSKYIRLKYANFNGFVACFTCGTMKHWKEIHAGHYHPRTHGMALYFEEKNVHPQCYRCNVELHSNATAYAIALQRKYGDGILKELEWKRQQATKISEIEYLRLIQFYKEKVRELEHAWRNPWQKLKLSNENKNAWVQGQDGSSHSTRPRRARGTSTESIGQEKIGSHFMVGNGLWKKRWKLRELKLKKLKMRQSKVKKLRAMMSIRYPQGYSKGAFRRVKRQAGMMHHPLTENHLERFREKVEGEMARQNARKVMRIK